MKTIPRRIWIREVAARIERKNTKRLLNDCYRIENSVSIPKTKTATIIERLNDPDYKRGMSESMCQLSRQECKTLIIARYKMLECGRNYKGTVKEECSTCRVIDDEDHILNHCSKYEKLREPGAYVNFDDVHSDQIEKIRNVITPIEMVWNTTNAHGTLRRDW